MALAREYDQADDQDVQRTPRQPGESHILFFDGGSRGNPGRGGSGAVLVSTDRDAMNPRVEWSGCMSYVQADMTNNRAEYMGVITGLREAKERGWKVEVVGDSNLILRQLAEYRPPRNAKLRPLYCEARRLADQVQVTVWQHHLRAYNKMADAAANEQWICEAASRWTTQAGGPIPPPSIDSYGRIFKNGTLATSCAQRRAKLR